MTRIKTTLALALALAGMSPLAQAAVYTDIDLAGPGYAYLNKNGKKDGGETSKDAYTGTFNILNEGYNPLIEQITEATFWFAFADDSDDGRRGADEIVQIKIEDRRVFEADVDGSTWSYDWVWGSIGGSLLATLSSTGILDYTVNILSGDAYLKEAGLTATSSARQVPDSSATVALLGLGLLGLAAVRHRMA